MASFHEVWKLWHIYDVRNPQTYGEGDGEVHHMLDGIEDFIRPSMRLRALSERDLRKEQLQNGWTNEQLVEHLRGDHDGSDTADEEILAQLRYLGCEDEAGKFIPEDVLRDLMVD